MRTGPILLVPAIFLLTMAVITVAFAQSGSFPSYEAYLSYLGNSPYNKEGDWTDNAQGISHDEEGYWYITQKRLLYRVPLGQSLEGNIKNKPGVQRVHIDDIPQLADLNYDHFGDISVFRLNESISYVLVPVDSGDEDAVMAVFRADETLEYVGKGAFAGKDGAGGGSYPDCNVGQGEQAGWIAADGDGFVYSSRNTTTALRKYEVRWEQVESSTQPVDDLLLECVDEIPLRDEIGGVLELENMQGGVVSPNNSLIYLTNGVCGSTNAGVHVVNLRTGTRVARSCQGGEGCLFRYQFDLCTLGYTHQEPEGITIWDLDDLVLQGAVANDVDGQLHILLLHNEIDQDNIYIKHYSDRLYVDDDAGTNGNGRVQSPFNNLSDALDLAWDGSTIVLIAGNYPGSFIIDENIRMEARTGLARIGE
ncbi:MAG: hypothetical protein ACE5Q6_21970 [Dehalococcoidia bacterium]